MSKDNPCGELTTRTLAMPADANPSGDIFGGWVMSQMDIAAGIRASERARGRTVTAAVDAMSFIRPVQVGDILCVYTEIAAIGRSSMKILVEAWAQRREAAERVKVTQALFTFVAVDKGGKSRSLPAEGAAS